MKIRNGFLEIDHIKFLNVSQIKYLIPNARQNKDLSIVWWLEIQTIDGEKIIISDEFESQGEVYNLLESVFGIEQESFSQFKS